MAIDLTTVGVKLEARGMAQVKGAFGDVSHAANKIKSNLTSLLSPTNAIKTAMLGIAGGLTGAAIGSFLRGTITEARDAEDKLSQLKVAVENTGASFVQWQPALDAAADGLEKVTRFSDEAARGALTTLITISGNVQGSLKNLGVTADLAAARHIDLESAAQLVGKAMIGNVTALGKMGIKAKEGADIMEVLRQKFQGFAETDAVTLTGRLDQVSNAWDNVKEAIGKAILGMGDVPGKTNAIRDSLVDLKKYIEENTETWRGWARNMLDPNWGPAKILNSITDAVNRTGLALHGIATGNFKPLEDYLKGPLTSLNAGRGESDHLGGDNGPGKIDATVAPGIGGAGKKVKDIKAPRGPGQFDSVSQARIDALGKMPSIMVGGIDLNGTPVPGIGMSVDDLDKLFENWNKGVAERRDQTLADEAALAQKAADMMASLATTLRQGIADTLGDAIYNGFAAAFSGEGLGGIMAAFGKTILAGVGSILTDLGKTWLSYGILMTSLGQALWNPFTSGPAAIAIGAALIALGGALGGIAHGGGGRGTAQAGAFRENPGEQMTRLKFIDRSGRPASDTKQTLVVNQTIIGTRDPKAQREIVELITNAQRRIA